MINPTFMGDAISSVCPNATWSLNEPFTYEDLIWRDEVLPKPSKEAVLVEYDKIKAEYEAKEYQRQRAEAYPSFAEQFDTLYHGGYDAWKATIDAVKQQYPKP
jgi:hypothetical protein